MRIYECVDNAVIKGAGAKTESVRWLAEFSTANMHNNMALVCIAVNFR